MESETTEYEELDTLVDEADDDVLDEEWLSETHRRSRWRVGLLAALAGALLFWAGVETQQHFGETSQTAGGLPSGFPQGGGELPSGFPQGGQFPGAGDQGSGQESGDQVGSTQQDQGEAVIGTVVSKDGDTWVVKDLGGKKHTVTVDSDTAVTQETKVQSKDVEVGATVDIQATESGSGDLTADSVTVR